MFSSNTSQVSGAATDPDFEYVTMLLHGDGTNGAQNNTFLDSSTNNFTITRSGNTTQGSFSPYGTLWSNYFDGSGDYLTVPATGSAFDISTGDFTIESWVYMNESVNGTVAALNKGSGVDGIYFVHGGGIYVTSNSSSWDIISLGTIPGITANAWNHVALVRNGNSWVVYLNGVNVHSVTSSASVSFTGTRLLGLGATGSGAVPLTGYISNLRIVKGVAVYTSAFTPSTTPLTAVSGTSLLTCQSNRFIDNSSNAFAVTVNGNTSVQRFSPFAPSAAYSTATIGGSGYFDGSGDYLVTTSSFPTIGSGDYCINFWVYPLRSSPLAGIFELGTYAGGMLVRATPGSGVEVWINGTQIATSDVIKQNAWNYVCIFRESGQSYIFVNGVQQLFSTAHSGLSVSSYPAKIGTTQHSAYTENLYGYLCDLRVNVGTTSIANQLRDPPTVPISGVSNTQLFTKFQNAAIFDNAMMDDLETVGNAQISTSVKKYGTGSLYFDGSGDSLLFPNRPVYILSSDFTVETFAYIVAYQNGPILQVGTYLNGVWLRSTTGTEFAVNNSFGTISNYTTVFPLNTWLHVAITRSGSTVRLFVGGVLVSTITGVTGVVNTTGALQIGSSAHQGGEFFNGYLDEHRITKGVARYTANFTPPTQAFPNN